MIISLLMNIHLSTINPHVLSLILVGVVMKGNELSEE